MHEHSILDGVMSLVRDEVRKRGLKSVSSISLVLGDHAGLEETSLLEAFHHFRHHHADASLPVQTARLIIRHQKESAQCPVCGFTGNLDHLGQACPSCHTGCLSLPDTLMGLFLEKVDGSA